MHVFELVRGELNIDLRVLQHSAEGPATADELIEARAPSVAGRRRSQKSEVRIWRPSFNDPER